MAAEKAEEKNSPWKTLEAHLETTSHSTKWSRDNETGTKFEEMILVTLLLCEHIGRIIFPPDVVDDTIVKQYRIAHRAPADI